MMAALTDPPGGSERRARPEGACRRMLAQVTSATVFGIDAYPVRVEVDLANGLPCMNVVGLPESAVREGRERVSAALANSGFSGPNERVTINLAPADVRKGGVRFDLPVALGLRMAAGQVSGERAAGACVVGELGLNGEVRAVRGVLPVALQCVAAGIGTLIVPAANGAEAAIVEPLEVRVAASLNDVISHVRGERR